MDSKFAAKSKTIQGLIIAAGPAISSLLGISWGEEDTAQLNMILGSLITLIGTAWAFYGRVDAKQTLSFKMK